MVDAFRGRDALSVVVPVLAAAAAAIREQVVNGVSVCVVVAIVLAPVWIGALREYRWARTLVALGLAAAAWGAGATLLQTERGIDLVLLRQETGTLLSLVGGAGLLLWARSRIGVGATVLSFAVGALLNVALSGGNPANLWKYSLAVPVALLLLGLAARTGERWLPVVVLGGLAIVSALSDSRSMTSFLLLAGAAMLWQAAGERGSRARPWTALVALAAVGLAAASLLQALILDGVLGQSAQQRSEAQIDASGSIITGARPELGAATALIAARPLGYGSGTLPSSRDVWSAKQGMQLLGYDPDNGYVDRFMFGGHYEVHSVLGDLWIRFGPLGAALVVLIVAVGIAGLASGLSVRHASGALVLLALLGAWDALFSPMLTSYRSLALLFAIAAVPLVTASASRPSRRSGAPSAESSTPS